MPLPPDLRDFMYYCDSFRFFALFTVYFFGKGSRQLIQLGMDEIQKKAAKENGCERVS